MSIMGFNTVARLGAAARISIGPRAGMTRTRLPRQPKRLDPIPGQRPLDEQLLGMIVSLASETTVLRARLDACERLLVASKALAPGAVDDFSPDEAAQAERDALRQRAMDKIFRPLKEAAEADLQLLSQHGATETSG